MRTRLATILLIASPFVLLPVAAAYVQWGAVGLPALPPGPARSPETVENPVELSLDDLRAMAKKTQITLHHCIQGWSGIAEWGGLTTAALLDLVRPKPNARVAIFYSFGEGLEGGHFYDSHTIENLMHPQSLLAYEMNFEPLNEQHGAPLRLRVENQLGFKMVKWIRAIEFVESVQSIGKGEGGYNEDNEYFGELASI